MNDNNQSLLMQYKDYVWPRNPKDINITVENNVKDIEIPKSGSVFQRYERKKRIVNGTGNFVGSECFNEFRSLFNLFKNSTGESGYLAIPNLDPFLAIFKSLKLTGEQSPELVTYTFTFWENTENLYESEVNIKTNYHIASGDESLWNVSLCYKLAVESLLKLNPFVKDPNEILAEGVRISLC